MKRIVALTLALLMILSLAACGQTAPEPTPEPTAAPTPAPTPSPTPEPVLDIDAYRAAANDIVSLLDKIVPWLSVVINYENKYAEISKGISGGTGYEKAFEAAKKTAEENGVDWESYEKLDQDLREMYKSFIKIDTMGNKIGDEIYENTKTLFEDYCTMYSFAHSPTASALNTLSEAVQEYTKVKDILLSIYLSE